MDWGHLLDQKAIASLLPVDYAHFAKPVCHGLAVFLQGLPESRQAKLFLQQATLDRSTDISQRLALLAHSCPVLQKIGQILARDQRLSPDLRLHLRQLESLPPSVPFKTIKAILDQELGSLARRGITLAPAALAEASVAVVVPFQQRNREGLAQGVFKILKPGMEELLESELGLLEQVGLHLDERCDELGIPHLDYQEAFQQVREKLWEEICLENEQRNITAAREFYADEDHVQIPALLDCCTPRVTAMSRVWGDKVTNHQFTKSHDRRRIAKMVVNAMIAKPVFSEQSRALFHCDPHAGNLFLTTDGRIGILDWSLVGWLGKQERVAIVQILLSAVTQNEQRMVAVLRKMALRHTLDQSKLSLIVKNRLRQLRQGQFPGLFWLVGMLDEAVRDARFRLNPDLMMFRKSLYTLEGVVTAVGGTAATFDQVLCLQFLQHFAMEWPSRWLATPASREFATRLSNFDLTQAILSCPASLTRFWMGQGLDLWNASQTSRQAPCRRS